MMMNRVVIIARGIRVYAYHGVLPREREEGQQFVVDVELELDATLGGDDELGSTVDYSDVVRIVEDESTRNRFNLVETLARHLAEKLLSAGGVSSVSVTVKKPDAPLAVPFEWVGVKVSLKSQDSAEGNRSDGGRS